MAVKIVLNQAGNPTAGVAGFAREDFVLGTPVSASLTGGPFANQLWTVLDKPIDIEIATESSAAVVNPSAESTTISPVDVAGTYLLQVVVDSGQGLGATPDDIAQITFYAGPALNTNPGLLPRRIMAFLERALHNVRTDPIYGAAGNKRGWAQEMLRWFVVLRRAFLGSNRAWARVALTSGGASIVAGYMVSDVERTAEGTVLVTFTEGFENANYAACANARGLVGGSATVHTETETTCVVSRADPFGVAVDADFVFEVKSAD